MDLYSRTAGSGKIVLPIHVRSENLTGRSERSRYAIRGLQRSGLCREPGYGSGAVTQVVIVPRDKNAFNVNEFTRFLGEHIYKNKMPKKIFLLDELPKTFNGKLNREELSTLV